MSLSNRITRRKLKIFLDLVVSIAPEFEELPGFQLLVRKTHESNNWIQNWSIFEKRLYKKLLKAVREEISDTLKASMFRSTLPTHLNL